MKLYVYLITTLQQVLELNSPEACFNAICLKTDFEFLLFRQLHLFRSAFDYKDSTGSTDNY